MIALRNATAEDEALWLKWRNEPGARANSFTSTEISPAEHHGWFSRRLGDPECILLIAEEEGIPVGQVRLDLDGDGAEISLAVDVAARGRGLGTEIIRLAVLRVPASNVKARIKPDNMASRRAFTSAGFTLESEDGAVAEYIARPLGETSPR